MCGICGIVELNGKPADRGLLEAMNQRIVHRGPDGDGFYFHGPIGLANRRLSIIDLSGGWQPQANEDGTVQVVFNGEIYNFIELREELQKKGHVFKTKSDTEVIVHGYEEWGDDCTQKFNGIFAFALHDRRRNRVVIARDHLGVKPLYYTQIGSRLLFSSEVKALLADKECPREVDLTSLSLLFTLRYVPADRTLFKGIQKLPSAHRMVIENGKISIDRFWKTTPVIRENVTESEAIEEYQALVEDAVKLQMRSDVPVGLFLSSGVDSGALLSIMSKLSNHPIQTFTLGFDDGEKTNENVDARKMAKMFNSDHREMTLSYEDYVKYYERYLWDIEEPVGNETAAAFYFLSRMTSEHVKCALAGQGADEPWAGYDRYLGMKYSKYYAQLPQFLTRDVMSPLGQRFVKNEVLKRGLSSLHEKDVLTRMVNVYSFFSTDMKGRLFQPWVKQHISANGVEAKRALGPLQRDVADLDPLTQILYMDTRTNLPDDLLMVGDKTSMANSLELRVPFLDFRLVEFIETLPPNLKIKGLNGKYLHKKAAEKWLPKEIVYRKKKGFANPVGDWLRTSMKPFVHESLLSSDSAAAKYFDQKYIRELLADHEGQQEQRRRHIYLLLSFELWHRQFISA